MGEMPAPQIAGVVAGGRVREAGGPSDGAKIDGTVPGGAPVCLADAGNRFPRQRAAAFTQTDEITSPHQAWRAPLNQRDCPVNPTLTLVKRADSAGKCSF